MHRLPLLEQLRSGLLLGDGAMGTMLQAVGLAGGECAERWNLEHPDRVLSVHRVYVEAGAQLIQTNTFSANRIKLAKFGLADQVLALNRAGAQLAREAAGDDVYVAASVGLTGEFLEPLGDLRFEDAVVAFAEQAGALAEGGADAILIETFSALDEARAAIEGARKATRLPVFCTMTFDLGGHTIMGVTPAQAAQALTEAGAGGVGSNCGTGAEAMLPVIEAMRQATDRCLIVQPNAGLPKLVSGKTIFEETPEQMAEYAEKFVAAGANWIGGCCGTTPEHIRAMAKRLVDSHQ